MATKPVGPGSAYALAKSQGFTGTLQEWLDSLKGSDGSTPTVSIDHSNLHWVINGQDTGIVAQGQNGGTPDISIGGNDNWFINGQDTGVRARGENGNDGNGISGYHVYYAVGDNDTTAPGTWVEQKPAVPQGKYLWKKTVISLDDSGEVTLYDTTYQAVDGTVGNIVLSADDLIENKEKYTAGSVPFISFIKSIPAKINAILTFILTKAATVFEEGVNASFDGNSIDVPDAFTSISVHVKDAKNAISYGDFILYVSSDSTASPTDTAKITKLSYFSNSAEGDVEFDIRVLGLLDERKRIWNGTTYNLDDFTSVDGTVWSFSQTDDVVTLTPSKRQFVRQKVSNSGGAGGYWSFLDLLSQRYDVEDVLSNIRTSVLPRLAFLETGKANIAVSPPNLPFDGNIADRPNIFDSLTLDYTSAVADSPRERALIFEASPIGPELGIEFRFAANGSVAVFTIEQHEVLLDDRSKDLSDYTDSNNVTWKFEDVNGKLKCTPSTAYWITSKRTNSERGGDFVLFLDSRIQRTDLGDLLSEVKLSVLPRLALLETKALPAIPADDGEYKLALTVSGGVADYEWVLDQ